MTLLTWYARIVEDGDTAVAEATVVFELFSQADRGWIVSDKQVTKANGQVGGEVEIADGDGFAPAARLIAGDGDGEPVLYGATAAISAKRDRLLYDFGTLSRVAVADRVSLVGTAPIRMRADPMTLGATPRELVRIVEPSAEALLASAVPLGDFTVRLGEQINNAQDLIRNRSFMLGAISVTTRGFMNESGGINLLEGSKPEQPVSEVKIDYQPTSGSGEASLQVPVPDLTQLTETAARRVLASLGLLLTVNYGPRGLGADSAPGQAMLQSPAAGERVARGAAVSVIFCQLAEP
jgi:hypothetical protein